MSTTRRKTMFDPTPVSLDETLEDLVSACYVYAHSQFDKKPMSEYMQDKFKEAKQAIQALIHQATVEARKEELWWCIQILNDPEGMSDQWKQIIKKQLAELEDKED
jgi:hypothetical protein